jgi:hypothetical protein
MAVSVPLTSDKFYVPGSLLKRRSTPRSPSRTDCRKKLDVFFDNSPVFRLKPDAMRAGCDPSPGFASDQSLRSGWAWGQKYLQDGVA